MAENAADTIQNRLKTIKFGVENKVLLNDDKFICESTQNVGGEI